MTINIINTASTANTSKSTKKETITLTPVPLTAKAFAPFGNVIELSNNNKVLPINYGLTNRHHSLATVEISNSPNGESGAAIISLFDCTPISLPFKIKIMERHPLGSQAFIPMHDQPYLVVVSKAGKFDQNTMQVFIAQADQGVNYHQGTWHHYCLALNKQCTFAVIDRGGSGNNCDEIAINDNIVINSKPINNPTPITSNK